MCVCAYIRACMGVGVDVGVDVCVRQCWGRYF